VSRPPRAATAVVGLGLLALGAWMLAPSPPRVLAGLGLWLVAAALLHDAVVGPLARLAGAGLGALTRGSPLRRRVALSAVTTAGALTLVALPNVLARARGPRNSSIHTTDYLLVLLVVWLVAALVLAVVGVGARRRGRTAGHR
jgi:hypothetical protein